MMTVHHGRHQTNKDEYHYDEPQHGVFLIRLKFHFQRQVRGTLRKYRVLLEKKYVGGIGLLRIL